MLTTTTAQQHALAHMAVRTPHGTTTAHRMALHAARHGCTMRFAGEELFVARSRCRTYLSVRCGHTGAVSRHRCTTTAAAALAAHWMRLHHA